MSNNIKLLYIDLFCGAGGTTTGVERARIKGQKIAKVIACVNHDPNAIASHLANHPGAVHFTEDIRTMELSGLTEIAQQQKQENPGARLVLWASLECTNFSNAKGGLPRDPDSRTLADHLFRYIEALEPDYIQIENVREFMAWGELDENGRPLSKDKGRLYLRWVNKVKRYGYNFDWRILNAADFGAYTSRERYFGIFARKGLRISFPEPTYQRNPQPGLFGTLKPWKPVRDVLDLEDTGRSIFRKKPLCEKTLQRIYAGLVKFVAGGGEQTKVSFLSKQFSGSPQDKNISIEGPAGTITCRDHHALITTYQFLDQQYGNGVPASINRPSGTVTTNPKFKLVTVSRKWHYLVNPQFQCEGASIDKPCFTLIARMDKKPPYIVTAQTGPSIVIYKGDSPMTVKIKKFMSVYGINDIYMRMLNEKELLRIQGFGEDYKLVGTSTERKKYIGNAVETHQAAALCQSLAMVV